MKRWMFLLMSSLLLLSACDEGLTDKEKQEIAAEKEQKKKEETEEKEREKKEKAEKKEKEKQEKAEERERKKQEKDEKKKKREEEKAEKKRQKEEEKAEKAKRKEQEKADKEEKKEEERLEKKKGESEEESEKDYWSEQKNQERIIGKSDQDFKKIKKSKPNKVRNDSTGNWRIMTIAKSVDIEDYLLSYNDLHMKEEEVHFVVNFNYETTTLVNEVNGLLYVDIHEYKPKEEHDANVLGSGLLLKSYVIYPDGDIEELEI